MSALVGRNVRRLREAKGLRQDDLARGMRRLGPEWTQATVAAVEAGTRSVAIEELVALGPALAAPLLELIEGADDTFVETGPGSWVGLWRLRSILDHADRSDADPREGFVQLVEPALVGAAEQKAAVRLTSAPRPRGKVDELDVTRAATELWGQTLTEHRDAIVASDAPDGASARSLQAIRGRVTRQLVAEIAEHLASQRKGRRG